MALAPGPEDFVCSVRECIAPARWKVIWTNPNLGPGHKKTWLACTDHLDYLRDYFGYRNFPYQVEQFSES